MVFDDIVDEFDDEDEAIDAVSNKINMKIHQSTSFYVLVGE